MNSEIEKKNYQKIVKLIQNSKKIQTIRIKIVKLFQNPKNSNKNIS